MKIFPKLDFYSQPLFCRMNSCSFSILHRTVPKTCSSHPAHSTQPFRCDCPAFKVLRLRPPPWRFLSLCESLISWKSDESYGLSPQKKVIGPIMLIKLYTTPGNWHPVSQCPCNSRGLTDSDPHYWLMLNWLTTETQLLRISAKAYLASPHIC